MSNKSFVAEKNLPVEPCDKNFYLHAATSDNTRKAYRADIRHFIAWGGNLPTTSDSVLRYLHEYAAVLNPRTLERRLTALRHWHLYQGFSDPTAYPEVAKMLTGIKNVHGRPGKRAKALRLTHLQQMSAKLAGRPHLRNLRTLALLQVQFFAALRVSELVALQVEWLAWSEEGVTITLPRSKTDQEGEGQRIAIPYAPTNAPLCPVKTLRQWLNAANITNGYVFRSLDKISSIQTTPITPRRVNGLLQEILKATGIQGEYSSHSLRSGFATEASRRRASLASIMRQGRWKKLDTVLHYIQEGQKFEDNAAAKVMEFHDRPANLPD